MIESECEGDDGSQSRIEERGEASTSAILWCFESVGLLASDAASESPAGPPPMITMSYSSAVLAVGRVSYDIPICRT